VHDNPIGYDYGWDLESFGRLYDVDKKINVQGENGFPFVKDIFSKTSISFDKV
jgi:hypothetical protein